MEKQLRLGVVGAGDFSNQHLQGIAAATNAVAVAICDVDIERSKTQAAKYGVPNVCKDYKELLARDDVDAITMPLPDQLHAEIAIAALRAGKHVLCEKPMALHMDECKEMIKVANETGKVLMVGQIGRYTPAFLEAKRIYESGAIGELFLIESEYAHDYKWVDGAPLADGTPWRKTPDREPVVGGGCHAVDLVRMIAGDPTEVFAFANNKSLTDWPSHDCSVAVMKFESGLIGKVMTSSGCKRNYTMRSLLYGTEGTIIFDNTSNTISLFKQKFSDDEVFEGKSQKTIEIKIPVEVNNHNFAAEVKDFCTAVLENREIVTDGLNGAKTVAVCLSIVESFKTGEKVVIDYNI